jgi:hypothetical protein
MLYNSKIDDFNHLFFSKMGQKVENYVKTSLWLKKNVIQFENR